ncbi:MAG: DUF3800 domain-containing protein [Dehalococcoidia bacterium]|nr:DUF3800 domain-containing protein [Dehalococcoidia bacterium]MDD5493186.1 DUF3800 domain-containing protein [Dehalococcoidia bacterium]
MPPLYVFIDVSGNYDFSPSGTKYLVLTSVMCEDVCPGVIDLHARRHWLIDGGFEVEYFHAAEDRQEVRNQVFDIISKFTHMRMDSVVFEKAKSPVSLHSIELAYPVMISSLFKDALNGIPGLKGHDRVFVFMDREFAHARDRESLIKGVKKYLSQHFSRTPYQVLMHSSMSHPYLQIVDYCSWAIYRKWENSDKRSYTRIRSLIKSELQLY